MNALLTGCVTERSGEMGFTETHKPQEDDVGLSVMRIHRGLSAIVGSRLIVCTKYVPVTDQ